MFNLGIKSITFATFFQYPEALVIYHCGCQDLIVENSDGWGVTTKRALCNHLWRCA